MIRVAVDATPLIGTRTGIGVYTARLVEELAGQSIDLVATAFTWRGRDQLAKALPAGVTGVSRPAPARILRQLWQHGNLPTAERLVGPVDLFHATNFVLPPLSSARGVLTIHDLAYLRFPSSVDRASLAYRELVPRGVGRAAVVCTPTRAVAEQVADAYRIEPDRVLVTPLGVDPSWFEAKPPDAGVRQAHGLDTEYILALGTLEPRKNLAKLLRAYRRCLDRGVDLPQLVLVGGQGWGEPLDLTGIPASAVVRTGWVDGQTARSLVAGASLLAFPSLDEGFGLPAVEALACGVPVLANDLPVTREVLADQATYCDATDSEALAEALGRVLTAPAGSEETRRARAAGFTWAATGAATMAAYEAATT